MLCEDKREQKARYCEGWNVVKALCSLFIYKSFKQNNNVREIKTRPL